MALRTKVLIIISAFSILILLSASTSNILDERDDKVGQLIHNTIKMSTMAGGPTLQQISQWKRFGTTSYGTGYTTMPVIMGSGSDRYGINLSVAFIEQSTVDIELNQFAPDLVLTDSVTGANVYISRDKYSPARKPNLAFYLYSGGVALRMFVETTGDYKEDADAINICIGQWRFFVAEAKRLGVIPVQ